ncbi:hypothetical protein [Streptomyces platensis]|uniref:hypothetical protein n=1 Tax=Streptomyces platensis TaxID=58346 RepID=UPI002F907124|nr:hypothetical protein OG962_37450 [Streptomyces platensis]
MPRTITQDPAKGLIAVVTGILGGDWTPPASTAWPAAFTNEGAERQLTVYPDRRNNRLVFVTASTDDPDDFDRQRFGKYTPDLTGHDTVDGWLADGDLDAVADALAVILERLVEQPLPERAAHTDPLEHEREHLAKQAKELAAWASHFAAGLVWSQPVADDAHRLSTLAQGLAYIATRVDELRGYKHRRR